MNALRKCAMTPVVEPESQSTHYSIIKCLSQAAEDAFSRLKELQMSVEEDSDGHSCLDDLSETLNEYWCLKKRLAAGSEPEHIRQLLAYLRPLCSAISLCGAGAVIALLIKF